MVEQCKALSDPARLRILRLMLAGDAEGVGERGWSVSQWVKVLRERQYNVSKQLKVMERVGLVARRKRGRKVYYGLGPAVLDGSLQATALRQWVICLPELGELELILRGSSVQMNATVREAQVESLTGRAKHPLRKQSKRRKSRDAGWEDPDMEAPDLATPEVSGDDERVAGDSGLEDSQQLPSNLL